MKSSAKLLLSVLLIIAVYVWTNVAKSPNYQDQTFVWFFDVGQGDATLIQKGSYQILIDGGPDDIILKKLGEKMPISDRYIESMILSHPHADHLIGLNQVLDRYDVGKIFISGVIHTSNEYIEFLEKVKNKNIETVIPNIGYENIPYENAKIKFLWPGNRYAGKNVDNLNNSSIVNKFCYYNECILFTGDIELEEQKAMFDYCENTNISLEAPYLKVAHHGSINGTDQKTIEIVRPNEVIISVGADNQFGHPHGGIIDLLLNNNLRIKRTDKDGDIIINLTQK